MARTVRDLIRSAAITSGVIEATENLENLELEDGLNELNNIIEQWNLDGFFPYTKVISNFTIGTKPVTPTGTVTFTVGKELVQDPGNSDNLVSGTITGLINLINDNTDIPTFLDAVITLDDGTELFVPGTSTMTEGKVSTDETFTVSVLEIIPPSTINFTPPDIPAGSTVFFSNFRINTVEGIFLNADVFIKRPNQVKSLSFDIGGLLTPLSFIEVDSWDNSIRGTTGFNWARFYTIRPDYPLMVIDVYPEVSGNFQMTSEIVLGEFDINEDATWPNGYYPALQYALAHLLSIRYGNNNNVDRLEKQAKEYLGRVKTINSMPRLLSTMGRPRGSIYNIYNDTYSGTR